MIKFLLCLFLLSPLMIIGARVSYAHSKQYKVEKQQPPTQYKKDAPDDYYKHKDQTGQTQVNQQTDLFEKSTKNWRDFQEKINVGKAVPCYAMEEDLSIFDKRGMAGARSEKDSLATIRAGEFDDKGSAKLSEFRESFGEGGDIYVDYERPLNKKHLEDAKEIAADQEELMGNLIGKLEEIGLDCKTEKGPIEMEPAFFMQVKREDHKDAIYNKTMCEELRGTYNCTDTMSITCLQRGWSHPWEPDTKEIRFTYGEIRARGWLGDEYWKSKRSWVVKHNYYKQKFFGSSASVKQEIVTRLGVKDGNVEMIRINRDGNGGLNDLGSRHYSWNDFSAFYRYRPGEVVCDKWSEERWDESCTQKR